MTIHTLVSQGNFLSLSRQQPELFALPIDFTLDNQTKVSIHAPGIISFTPPDAGNKDIVLSSGIHGNETAPIEICDDLVKRILTGDLQLAHSTLFIFGNLPSMDIAERFVEENMNRLFSGAHSKGPGPINDERIRARQIELVIENFYARAGEGAERERLHYDLHTAIRSSKNERFAVYPFTDGRAHSKEQLAFLGACGVHTVLMFETPQTTLSYFSSSRFQAHAFTVELGKVRPFGENDMSRFAAAAHTLQQLISCRELEIPAFMPEDFLLYRVNQEVMRETEGFELHFADDEPNFSDYREGTVLATDGEREIVAQVEGEAIVFPNARVAIGQRALLTVIPTSLEELDV